MAGYSNSTIFLDILAPADPVYTTDIVGGGGFTPSDYFPFFNGTSSACPFTAGAVAALQSAARERTNGGLLTPQEVRAQLLATGEPIRDVKSDVVTPMVNLARAIQGSLGAPIHVSEAAG